MSLSRSAYFATLSGDVLSRYLKKIAVINNIDPYTLTISECLTPQTDLPTVTMLDLVGYLVETHSYYTTKQLKAVKSLKAHENYNSGAILKFMAKKINDVFVVLSKVRHSQKMRESPLEVWIIILDDRSVSSAHCTCMAGLGEVCSHVATVLFGLHAKSSVAEGSSISCTDTLSKWPVPPMKNVEMMRIRDMGWNRKVRQTSSTQQLHIPSMNKDESRILLTKFADIGICSAKSLLTEPLASKIANEIKEIELPNTLEVLFKPELMNTTYQELMLVAKTIKLTITEKEQNIIEKNTREQALSSTWFKFRTGRITASCMFKTVCRTSIAKPSLTAIKHVCYPHKVSLHLRATAYGIKHEKEALQQYLNTMQAKHQNLIVRECGLIISLKHPELGASPDAMVSCDCCGLGVVEIKCPYLLKDNVSIKDYLCMKHSCLENVNGEISLKKNHSYYYQIQLQMFVTERKYCDFVVWSKFNIFIERLYFDEIFFNNNLCKALDFHQYVIKPELLARYFTDKGGKADVKSWCICEKPDDGSPMIQCDNDDCQIQWFHFDCVQIDNLFNVSWCCPNCIT